MLTRTSLIAAVTLIAATSTASAQSVCGTRETLLKQLASEYQEAPAGMGLASNGSVVELLTSKGGTSWTLMVTRPNGTTCLIGTGEAWQPVVRKASAEFDS
jgi:hypothetical protein